MTTAMERRLRASFPDKRVVIVGLANEYFSYTTTPEEYEKQQYEGASTLAGPQEGPALIDMLKEVHDCGAKCKKDFVDAETYRVGPYPATPFGPRTLKPPRNMVDEDMDPFEPQRLAYSETQTPRAEWAEDGTTDWLARDRSVRVFRTDGVVSTPVEDENGWNILTILNGSTETRRTVGQRSWNALWLLPPGTPRDVFYYFQVHIPGKGDRCSPQFQLSMLADRVPVDAQRVDRACPPDSRATER